VENLNQAFGSLLSGGIFMYLFACAHEEGICTFLIAFLKVMGWV
jgi:hypothetical protein